MVALFDLASLADFGAFLALSLALLALVDLAFVDLASACACNEPLDGPFQYGAAAAG